MNWLPDDHYNLDWLPDDHYNLTAPWGNNGHAISMGNHYYLVNGALLTGKIYTSRYNMAFQPPDWSRALIRVLIMYISDAKHLLCIDNQNIQFTSDFS